MTESVGETVPSRYVVGLDLGTTNSALAYVDTQETPTRIRTLAVPQLTAPNSIEPFETLPSFHYQPAAGEVPPGSIKLPWQASDPVHVVGRFARDQGTKSPGRLISSAKSWLSHPGVDRTADLLPWQGARDVDRLSPVTVSARYLQHFREAWDAAFPQDRLADQDFVLTLPASFDEVARELTVRAAQQAGLKRVVLIEEPQAAFYAWIDKHADNWDQLVSPGQKILVCDIGGGTTDFTLIRVRRGADGLVQFHRVAVGDHLILGGDNIDLALAHRLERKLAGDGELDPRVWSVLVRSCRQVKETLLGHDAPAEYSLSLPGSGSKLIGGAQRVPVSQADVGEVVLDGFFPLVSLDAHPSAARSGFQEFGLPYATDAAITKYLAAFLTAHRHAGDDLAEPATSHDPARPDLLLFNGGVFESTAIRQRIVEQLQRWFSSASSPWSVTVLDNDRLDLAVARGAAYYGMVRRGRGVKIAAGLARTYYVGIESQEAGQTALHSALCLCPAGLEPGEEVDLTQRQFTLRLSEPIELPLYVSSTRLTDRPGDLVTVEKEQLTALPPIRTVFKAGKTADQTTVRVILKARLTEIGTLDLWCREVDGSRTWKLLFDVRSATQTEIAAQAASANQLGVLDESARETAVELIHATFRPHGDDPATLMKRLGEALDMSRLEWPPTLLRQMWEALLDAEAARRLSAQYEARWLNMVGFSLRPGYGLAVDDWRVAETWKRLQGKVAHAAANCRTEWWILWRRIAGGLTAGQQQALATPLVSSLRESSKSSAKGKSGAQPSAHELAEQCRFLGALEWLSPAMKEQLGDLLLELAAPDRPEAVRAAAVWAVGRMGARRPVYGPLNAVVAPDVATRWLDAIMQLRADNPLDGFAAMQLARKTGDRYRDIPPARRDAVLKWMQQTAVPEHYRTLVSDIGTLDAEEQAQVLGDALPRGLSIA